MTSLTEILERMLSVLAVSPSCWMVWLMTEADVISVGSILEPSAFLP